jgi:hypothetical protein
MKENGLNAELSIGYNVINRDAKNKSIIKEYKLFEYSFLSSWAANEMSTVEDIKSLKSTYGIIELIEKSYNLKYSDQRLKQIETILKSLTDNEPPKDGTLNVEPIIKQKEILTNYINSL